MLCTSWVWRASLASRDRWKRLISTLDLPQLSRFRDSKAQTLNSLLEVMVLDGLRLTIRGFNGTMATLSPLSILRLQPW